MSTSEFCPFRQTTTMAGDERNLSDDMCFISSEKSLILKPNCKCLEYWLYNLYFRRIHYQSVCFAHICNHQFFKCIRHLQCSDYVTVNIIFNNPTGWFLKLQSNVNLLILCTLTSNGFPFSAVIGYRLRQSKKHFPSLIDELMLRN